MTDQITVDSRWAERRSHYGITPVRTYHQGKPVYSLPLEACEVDDPRRFGFFRGSWWRLAGEGEPPADLPTGVWAR